MKSRDPHPFLNETAITEQCGACQSGQLKEKRISYSPRHQVRANMTHRRKPARRFEIPRRDPPSPAVVTGPGRVR